MNSFLKKNLDRRRKERMFNIAREEYKNNFKIRFVYLLLIAITLTPFSLYILDTTLIDNIRDMLLSTLMSSLFLIGFLYHKDDYAEEEGFYIELKTIKKMIEINKKKKEFNYE